MTRRDPQGDPRDRLSADPSDALDLDPFFFRIHRGLPREGPGEATSTVRALRMIPRLPSRPLVLDLGCGPGPATMLLADETGGRVVGVDIHAPFLRDVRDAARRRDSSPRTHAVQADMRALPFAPATFDLVWSEGALYSVGLAHGLARCREILKPGGHLALTEAVWLRPDPPDELRRFWEKEYSALTSIAANAALVERQGFAVLGHFTLPETAWWSYYRPVEERLATLRAEHRDDATALESIAEAQAEIDAYRRYSRFYGYEFFVCRRD